MSTLGEQVSGMEQMDKLVTLCKRRGFVFANAEVYSGLSGFWDYGPLGVELKRNIERFWWDYMVRRRDNVVGLDSALIGPEAVWIASGHVGAFHDALVDDKHTKERFRIDQLLYRSEEDAEAAEVYALKAIADGVDDESAFWDGLKELLGYFPQNPNTGKDSRFTAPRQFNLMFKQGIGATGEGGQVGYLRAETCQPIFVDFDQTRISSRQRVPFGIAQMGKAFRNEINPRNFLYRAREFSQMELEFFVRPDQLVEQLRAAQAPETPGHGDQPDALATTMQWYDYWLGERRSYYTALGIGDELLRVRDHPPETLAQYANAASENAPNCPQSTKWKKVRDSFAIARQSCPYRATTDPIPGMSAIIPSSGSAVRSAYVRHCRADCRHSFRMIGLLSIHHSSFGVRRSTFGVRSSMFILSSGLPHPAPCRGRTSSVHAPTTRGIPATLPRSRPPR